MFAFVSLALLGQSALPSCTLSCKASPCYQTFTPVQDCLLSIPFSESWKNSTLITLTSALENYGFRDFLQNTGPPYDLQIDIISRLKALQSDAPESDIVFQEHVQETLQSPMDAHTRYTKPECYDATFAQPFSFAVVNISGEFHLVLSPNVITDRYQSITGFDPKPFLGKTVLLIDGLEAITAITSWANTHVDRSNDEAIRFNVAVREFLYRDQRRYVRPMHSALNFTFVDGKTLSTEWIGIFGPKLGKLENCVVAAQKSLTAAAPLTHSRFDVAHPIDPSILAAQPHRTVIIPTNSTTTVSCFTSNLNGNITLVLKVGSFSPPGDYLTAWREFIGDVKTCMSTSHDYLIVDVMQNGGGYVCLGLRTLTMIVKEFNQNHTLVQMDYDLIHSPLMDRYVDIVNAPQPYWDPQEVEQIMDPVTRKPFKDGRSYYYGRYVTQGGVRSEHTNVFWLDCHEAFEIEPDFKPAKFLPPSKLYVLTDGTCGSTCASFSKILQESSKATLVGLGGLWYQPMDVASFAGGFVCNPTLLNNIASKTNTTFPQFETTVRWQFDWAVWYSKRQPSRPIQFTFQPSDLRVPFWDFPHPSIDVSVSSAEVSALYDTMIEQIAANQSDEGGGSSSSGGHNKRLEHGLLAGLVVMSAAFVVSLGLTVFIWRRSRSGTQLRASLMR